MYAYIFGAPLTSEVKLLLLLFLKGRKILLVLTPDYVAY